MESEWNEDGRERVEWNEERRWKQFYVDVHTCIM